MEEFSEGKCKGFFCVKDTVEKVKKMLSIVDAAEMKQFDKTTSRVFKVPELVLMEQAALSARAFLRQERAAGEFFGNRVLIACGSGNNGADGMALARLLWEDGYYVTVWFAGDANHRTESAQVQSEILQAYEIPIQTECPIGTFDVIVDALMGIGGKGTLKEAMRAAITAINQMEGYVMALDIPSGVDASDGSVQEIAVKCNSCITFSYLKKGLVLFPGMEYAGRVCIGKIGITDASFLGQKPRCFALNEQAEELLPSRKRDGNKGTFGKVTLLTGSEGMAGAAILCSRAAFTSGCGMVRVVSDPGNREILQTSVPEAMTSSNDSVLSMAEACRWADVLGAGPGLGTGPRAAGNLRWLLANTDQPLVLDADALNLLAMDPELAALLAERQSQCPRELIFTPHPAELARLCHTTVKAVLQDPFAHARTIADTYGAVVLCKGARTIIACRDGRFCINLTGNSGMACAGSGDVLTGLIAGLLGQGMDADRAACVGVYLHGSAGDSAAIRLSEYAMTAGDLVEELRKSHDCNNREMYDEI